MAIWGHIPPREFNETDYYELVEIMSAKPRDKRPISLWDFAEQIDKKGGN